LAGGAPGPGVMVEGVKEVKEDFYVARNIRKRRKNGWFLALLDFKNAENVVFYLKYLTKYTPKTFFEEYINFKIFCYLRRYGAIPVRSFRSHMPPSCPD
jgi:hypothetical protein